MIRACFKILAAAACGAAFALPLRAPATLVADPSVLYRDMKSAYGKAALAGWSYESQTVYLATIFNAGRAYSLQRPDDSGYAELAQLTVDVAASLHYDPLINHDAVEWYVREAALWVQKNNGDPAEQTRAQQLLDRVNALEAPDTLAQYAIDDAAANRQTFPRDRFVRVQQVEAAWRAYTLTKDPKYRAQAMRLASQFDFPLENVPATWGPGFIQEVHSLAAGSGGDSATVAAAKTVDKRLKTMKNPPIIASVKGVPHDVYLTTLAPADEYFGPMGISVLGMRNELNRVNANLNLGWGDHESGAAVQLSVAIDDLHKVYPRDRDLPKLLLETYTLLGRIHTKDAGLARVHMRSILTVEYQDSPQAKELLEE